MVVLEEQFYSSSTWMYSNYCNLDWHAVLLLILSFCFSYFIRVPIYQNMAGDSFRDPELAQLASTLPDRLLKPMFDSMVRKF